MRNRVLVPLLVLFATLPLTAAKTSAPPAKKLAPPFITDVVSTPGKIPFVRLTVSEELSLLAEADLSVICYDAAKNKLGEHKLHIVRRDPDPRKPWVNVLRFPPATARQIASVEVIALSAKMAPPGGYSQTACLSFCQHAGNECNYFCATQPPPAMGQVSGFTCGPADGGCEAHCLCDNGQEAWY